MGRHADGIHRLFQLVHEIGFAQRNPDGFQTEQRGRPGGIIGLSIEGRGLDDKIYRRHSAPEVGLDQGGIDTSREEICRPVLSSDRLEDPRQGLVYALDMVRGRLGHRNIAHTVELDFIGHTCGEIQGKAFTMSRARNSLTIAFRPADTPEEEMVN